MSEAVQTVRRTGKVRLEHAIAHGLRLESMRNRMLEADLFRTAHGRPRS